jgi:hypothetical protein
MGHFLISLKIDYFNEYWSFKISVVKMRQGPYYTNVHWKLYIEMCFHPIVYFVYYMLVFCEFLWALSLCFMNLVYYFCESLVLVLYLAHINMLLIAYMKRLFDPRSILPKAFFEEIFCKVNLVNSIATLNKKWSSRWSCRMQKFINQNFYIIFWLQVHSFHYTHM